MSSEPLAATVASSGAKRQRLIEVRDLRVVANHADSRIVLLDGADLVVDSGHRVGLVGESGSGKTMLCRALLGTLGRHGARVESGRVEIDGVDATRLKPKGWSRLRGGVVGYVSQAALAGLNPTLTVRQHLVHAAMAIDGVDRREARARARESVELVELPRAERLLDEYPSQLSGGMRQRVVIASALVQRPRVLVADEPTTALDVTVQRAVMDLLARLTDSLGMSLVLVTHDLALVEEYTDDIAVLYAGATIESGPTATVLDHPRHPYTSALQGSRLDLLLRGRHRSPVDSLAGAPPQPGEWPAGCRFGPRCEHFLDMCAEGGQPPLVAIGDRHRSGCVRAEELHRP